MEFQGGTKNDEVERKTVSLAEPSKLAMDIFIYLLNERISFLKSNTCEGCKIEACGQLSHIPGCLEPQDETIERLYKEAKNYVSYRRIKSACELFLRKVKVSVTYISKGQP